MKQETVSPFFATLRAANLLPMTERKATTAIELLAAVLVVKGAVKIQQHCRSGF